MRVSVVIPALNEEHNLPKTLKSIKIQTRQPDELLVVDGGSTDNTAGIARSFGAIVILSPNTSISQSRQHGLDAATGDIIATTDADTIVPPDWLQKITETLEMPGVVGYFSGYRVLDGWLPYRFFVNVIHPIIFYLSQWSNHPISPGQNTAYWKKSALEAGGYPVEFKSAEDIELSHRLKKVGIVKYRGDNYVTSSGRRGQEGVGLAWRMTRGMIRYYLTGKADTFGFPHIR